MNVNSTKLEYGQKQSKRKEQDTKTCTLFFCPVDRAGVIVGNI